MGTSTYLLLSYNVAQIGHLHIFYFVNFEIGIGWEIET